MNTRTHTKKIIETAKQAFLNNGYQNTTVDALIKASGTDKTDFENAVGGKEECCLRVLRSYTQQVKKNLEKFDENLNTRQRLSLYLEEYFENADEIASKGDAIFNLYCDLRDQDNDLSKAVINIMTIQHDWVDEQFIIMMKTQSAVDQGDRLMAALHGLFFLARLKNDPAMFKSQLIQLKSWIRSM
ncbi:MAG: TetR/AcrR family transcriptional regulator [Emcibacteraceae bacterium]|nr:TetR/AcrR family transcriptional regulator [Emcibacteraceae bacterium]MDG1859472.1 TetR/AcrR family transcriptional regulator [Emcibacteraceae bacterium]